MATRIQVVKVGPLTPILTLFALCAWMAGLVIAKGFWSTLFALFPPWAWYLVAEKIMQHYGLLACTC